MQLREAAGCVRGFVRWWSMAGARTEARLGQLSGLLRHVVFFSPRPALQDPGVQGWWWSRVGSRRGSVGC